MTIPLCEIQKLQPDAIIELFVVDASTLGAGIFRFHAGTNELRQNLVWQGNEYTRYPIQAMGFEYTGSGPAPRPTMTVSNILSGVTALLLSADDLIGAKVIRKRTLRKYLDVVNFLSGVNPTADPTAFFPDEEFFIDRKVNESRQTVEFELASALDLSGVMIPRRQVIQNSCAWKYRGAECGYTGTNYFKRDDSPTTDSAQDSCSKRLGACKLRFGDSAELPYGGFPGADLFNGG